MLVRLPGSACSAWSLLTAPLAPRPNVELRPRQTASLHRQQEVTGSDTRTAVANHSLNRDVIEDARVALAKHRERIKHTVAVELRLPVEVVRSRDVSCYWIEWLRPPLVTLGSARIDQAPTRIHARAFNERRVDDRPMVEHARIRTRELARESPASVATPASHNAGQPPSTTARGS